MKLKKKNKTYKLWIFKKIYKKSTGRKKIK